MTQTQIQIDLHPVSALVPHEMTDAFHRSALLHQIRHNQYLVPIVADRQSGVVLDGHHRLHAARALGLSRIPVAFVDYADSGIQVKAWADDAVTLDKKEIVQQAAAGTLYLPKTTRHEINGRHVSSLVGAMRVALSELV